MQEPYARSGKLDEALVRSRLRQLRGDLLGVRAAPEYVMGSEGAEAGRTLLFELTGRTDGTVWGTDVYTGDSRLSTAAVHAGAVRAGERGFVRATGPPSTGPTGCSRGVSGTGCGRTTTRRTRWPSGSSGCDGVRPARLGALLRAVVAAPDDDVPRLVAADWLDEHGEAERAEFIRVQVELALFEMAGRGGWEAARAVQRRERALLSPVSPHRSLWAAGGVSGGWFGSRSGARTVPLEAVRGVRGRPADLPPGVRGGRVLRAGGVGPVRAPWCGSDSRSGSFT